MNIDEKSFEEENDQKSPFKDIKYLTQFITRSFLIAVVCFVVLLGVVFTIYCVDLYMNTKAGTSKSPLFNAYVIVSPSMVPTIKINDAVVVKRNDDDYNVGDIITFLSSDINYKGLTITHRVVNKGIGSGNRMVYTTKGDNNSVSDPATVSNDAIYGKVIFKIPKVGYIHSFLSKPTNFFLCILIPATIVIIYDLFRIVKMMSKKEEII